MYACITYVCMYICVYVCICEYLNLLCMHASGHLCKHACMHAYVSVCGVMHMSVYVAYDEKLELELVPV